MTFQYWELSYEMDVYKTSKKCEKVYVNVKHLWCFTCEKWTCS